MCHLWAWSRSCTTYSGHLMYSLHCFSRLWISSTHFYWVSTWVSSWCWGWGCKDEKKNLGLKNLKVCYSKLYYGSVIQRNRAKVKNWIPLWEDFPKEMTQGWRRPQSRSSYPGTAMAPQPSLFFWRHPSWISIKSCPPEGRETGVIHLGDKCCGGKKGSIILVF